MLHTKNLSDFHFGIKGLKQHFLTEIHNNLFVLHFLIISHINVYKCSTKPLKLIKNSIKQFKSQQF